MSEWFTFDGKYRIAFDAEYGHVYRGEHLVATRVKTFEEAFAAISADR